MKPALRALLCLVALVLLLTWAWPAFAEVAFVARSSKGALELHDEVGICVSGANQAVFVYNDGERVLGCWRFDSVAETISVGFLDGDGFTVPAGVFTRPVRL